LLYGYGLAILALIILAWLFVRSPRHRWPVAIMFAGATAGRVFYTLEAAHVLPTGLPFNVPPIALEYAAYAVALFGFRIFDPIPAARRAVIAQMREGVLVLDPEGRVAGLNPAAKRILGLPANQAMGRPVRELLPVFPDGPLADPAGAELEIGLPARRKDGGGVGQEVRQYVLEISPLSDWRGLETGRLLLLRDVTERRRAQAQILEQQRALAMLREREQLARELHDSLGQVFAFVNTQGQTVRRLLSRGDIATADALVGRLVEVAREADVDIRESILGLRETLSERGLLPALADYLRQYEKNYGVRSELEAPESRTGTAFEPQVEVQLLRIVQEALANVRKHAEARCVRVAFAVDSGRARVTVQDDGQGFDPSTRDDGSRHHVGLRVMRERAEQVGGRLEVISQPGEGTRVVVEVPLRQ
jgi:PAS domain S-box-containing protein